MKKVGIVAAAMAASIAGITQAGIITDQMFGTGPSERSTYSGSFSVRYDDAYKFDPVYSDGYVFGGNSGSQGSIYYVAASGTYFSAMTVSVAINGTSAIQILDGAGKLLAITTSDRVSGTGGVEWYTATFSAADNASTPMTNLESLTVVLYFGSWGASASRIGTVQLTESALPVPEACSLGLLAIGSTLALRRKKAS